ncbi:MAG: NAD(P)-dependent oxidoreductase [Opitutales bacterium]|jgi:3-hydroxyisobutyrate dehydrogenase
MRIAFVGTGVMGASMAGHLLRAGHEVVVHTRTRAKAEPLLAAGARWADSPAAAVAGADAALSMVGYPADVEQVWRGFLSAAPRGCLLIDLTTSSPALARRLAADAVARGLRPLDAPVSGGDRGAREATLTVMTGGSEEDHAAALPVLSLMGRTVERLGGPGAGQLCKLANQIAVASGMVAMTETLAFARAVGLDLAVVHRAVSGGAAGSWPMTNLAPRVLRGDFAPGFYAKHLVKDLGLALETARECGVELPGLELAARLYDRVLAAGDGDLGTQALARRYFGAA